METTKAVESAVLAHDEKQMTRSDDGLPPEVAALMKEFTGAKYDKLMRKLDMRLIPIVSFHAVDSIDYWGDFDSVSDCHFISPGVPGPVSCKQGYDMM